MENNLVKCEICGLLMKTRLSSCWTNTLHPIEDKLKKLTTLASGYNFLKLIFNYKGNLLTKEFYERN